MVTMMTKMRTMIFRVGRWRRGASMESWNLLRIWLTCVALLFQILSILTLILFQMDYGSSHRLSISQPLTMHGLAPPSGGGGSTLPISSMRDPNVSKRSRIGMPGSHSRSPSDDLPPPGSGPGPYSYHPGQNSSSFSRPSNSPYQHHPQHHASQHHASQQHHQHHHQGQQQHHSNQQYQPFFSQHASPPPSFIPLQSDFRSSGQSSRSGGTGSGGGPGFGLPTRTNSSSSSYETGMYSSMIRPSGGSQSAGPAGSGGSGGTGGSGNDLFVAFLDADEQTRHQSQSSQGSGFPMDWPVHSSSSGGGNTQSSGNPGGGGGSGPSTSSSGGFWWPLNPPNDRHFVPYSILPIKHGCFLFFFPPFLSVFFF